MKKYILSVFKRINGKVEQFNMARETDLVLSEEIKQAFLADEAARLREKWRLDQVVLRIKQYKEMQAFEYLKQIN